MYGFVRKFGKAKTFSNLVVRFQEIFFLKRLLQQTPSQQFNDATVAQYFINHN